MVISSLIFSIKNTNYSKITKECICGFFDSIYLFNLFIQFLIKVICHYTFDRSRFSRKQRFKLCCTSIYTIIKMCTCIRSTCQISDKISFRRNYTTIESFYRQWEEIFSKRLFCEHICLNFRNFGISILEFILIDNHVSVIVTFFIFVFIVTVAITTIVIITRIIGIIVIPIVIFCRIHIVFFSR